MLLGAGIALGILVLAGIVPRGWPAVLNGASALALILAAAVTGRRNPDGIHRRGAGPGRDHPVAGGRAGKRPGAGARPVAGGPAAGDGAGLTFTRGQAHGFFHAHSHSHDLVNSHSHDLVIGHHADGSQATANIAAAQRYMQARYAGSTNIVHYSGAGYSVTGGAGGSGSSNSAPAGGGGGGGGYLGLPPSAGLASRDGFSEEEGPPLVAGFHTGYRWWYLPAPDLSRSPADADEWWDPDYKNLLHGARAPWPPGVSTAVCLSAAPYRTGLPHDPETIPDATCGCGHWAYWQLQHHSLGGESGRIPVCGVIKGWGRTRRGPLGFRCAKARILAVTLPSPVVPVIGERAGSRWYPAMPDVREAGDGGKVIVTGGKAGYDLNGPEIRAALSHAEAWTAVIGDRIEQMYPGVRVFESVNAMRAVFPPDPEYPGFACPSCGAQGTGSISAHLPACSARFWQAGPCASGG
jgi:hypothetical protein